jgi:hypothetical protein
MELVFGYRPRQLYSKKKCSHPTFSNQIVRCVAETFSGSFREEKNNLYLHKRTPVASVCKIPVNIFIMKSETNLNSYFLRTGKECTFVAKKFPRDELKQTKKCRSSERLRMYFSIRLQSNRYFLTFF